MEAVASVLCETSQRQTRFYFIWSINCVPVFKLVSTFYLKFKKEKFFSPPRGIWNLSSPSGNCLWPLPWKHRVLTTGWPGYSWFSNF